jgi:hypothetical protein
VISSRSLATLPVLFPGMASVLHNPSWDHAVVAFKDLPQLEGKEYHLVVVDHDGQLGERIASIGSGSDKNIGTVNVDTRFVKSGSSLAIVVAGHRHRHFVRTDLHADAAFLIRPHTLVRSAAQAADPHTTRPRFRPFQLPGVPGSGAA